jgi:hypothetical protein
MADYLATANDLRGEGITVYVAAPFGETGKWVFDPTNYFVIASEAGVPTYVQSLEVSPVIVNERGVSIDPKTLSQYFLNSAASTDYAVNAGSTRFPVKSTVAPKVWLATFNTGSQVIIFAEETIFEDSFIYLDNAIWDQRTRSITPGLVYLNPNEILFSRNVKAPIGLGINREVSQVEFSSPALKSLTFALPAKETPGGNRPIDGLMYYIDPNNVLYQYNERLGWIAKDVQGISASITGVRSTSNNFGELLVVSTDDAPYAHYAFNPDAGFTYKFSAFNYGPLVDPAAEVNKIVTETNNATGLGYIGLLQDGTTVTIWSSSPVGLTPVLQLISDDTITDFSITSSGGNYWVGVAGNWTTLTVNKAVSGSLQSSSKTAGHVFAIQDIAGTVRDQETEVWDATTLDPGFVQAKNVSISANGNIYLHTITNDGSENFSIINYLSLKSDNSYEGYIAAATKGGEIVINDAVSFLSENGAIFAIDLKGTYDLNLGQLPSIVTQNGQGLTVTPYIEVFTESPQSGFFAINTAKISQTDVSARRFNVSCMCAGNTNFFSGRQSGNTWAQYDDTGIIRTYIISNFALEGIATSTDENLGFVYGKNNITGNQVIYQFNLSTGTSTLLESNLLASYGFNPNRALTPGQQPMKIKVTGPGTCEIILLGTDTVTNTPAWLHSDDTGANWTKIVPTAGDSGIDNTNSYISDFLFNQDGNIYMTLLAFPTENGRTFSARGIGKAVANDGASFSITAGESIPQGSPVDEAKYASIVYIPNNSNLIATGFPYTRTARDRNTGLDAFIYLVESFVYETKMGIIVDNYSVQLDGWSSTVYTPPVISGSIVQLAGDEDSEISTASVLYWSGAKLSSSAADYVYFVTRDKSGFISATPSLPAIYNAEGTLIEANGMVTGIKAGEKETYQTLFDARTLNQYVTTFRRGGFGIENPIGARKFINIVNSTYYSATHVSREVTYGTTKTPGDKILGTTIISQSGFMTVYGENSVSFVQITPAGGNETQYDLNQNMVGVTGGFLNSLAAAPGFSSSVIALNPDSGLTGPDGPKDPGFGGGMTAIFPA